MLSKNQLSHLNAQEQYADKVENQVRMLIQSNYGDVEKHQKHLLAKFDKEFQTVCDNVLDKMDKADNRMLQMSEYSKRVCDKMFKLQTWKDVMYYVTPAALVGNIIIKIVGFFLGG